MGRRSGCDRGYLAISAYALIGNCHTAALVSAGGSIDWYCPTRFDEPAVFCRLLDAERGGYLSLAPARPHSSIRRYAGPTNLLETIFDTPDGKTRLTDFMPVHARHPAHQGYDVGTSFQLLRLIEGVTGETEMEIAFKPTFDFGRTRTEITLLSGGAVASGHGHQLALACPEVSLNHDGAGGVRGRFTVRAGERRWIALGEVRTADDVRRHLRFRDWDRRLAETREYWESWARNFSYRGPYRDEVLRSALALKLLTYEPSGALVAAPTTSLPEDVGGLRNWDYRYSWLRDSSLILYALMTIGYQEESTDFFCWLDRVQRADPAATPQIVYTVEGGRSIMERELDNLQGYRCSRPVRVGNGAANQVQLDIFGEVLRAADLHYRGRRRHAEGIGGEKATNTCPPRETWRVLRDLVEQAAARWQEPDRGLWEVRSEPKCFLYSRLMCWAALDRGIRLARDFELPAPIDRWCDIEATIRQAILTHGYDQKQGAFTQAFGSSALDASALAIPLIGFLPATDPRVKSTVERIRGSLTQDGLVYRYRTRDGFPGGEATFALCSFWMVRALALGGRLDEAHDLFEKVSGCANDVGLLSEEIDPATGELLGNFPQGFTHMALIVSAVDLAKAQRHGAETQAKTEAERAGLHTRISDTFLLDPRSRSQ